MSFDLDATSASKIAGLRRRWSRRTQADAEQAILGDENGRISVDSERHYFYVRLIHGTNADDSTQYGHAFPVLSGGGYSGSEQVGTEVYIAMRYDGLLGIIGTNRTAIVNAGRNPRAENFNSVYRQFTYMKNADLFMATPMGTRQTKVLEVRVEPATYVDADGVVQVFAGAKIDLAGDVPAADGDDNAQHLIVGVFVNTSNALVSFTSTAKLTSAGLTWATDVAEVYAARSARALPVRYYRLYTGLTLLTKADEFLGGDGREWITAPKRKNNYTATTAPTVNDDIDDGVGYEVGSVWIDVTNDLIYRCIDSTSGAAIWRRLITAIAETHRIDSGDSPYTVTSTVDVLYCDTDGGAITVNLPAGVNGQSVKIHNVGTSGNNITIDGNGAETVKGQATQTLIDAETLELTFETTEHWW